MDYIVRVGSDMHQQSTRQLMRNLGTEEGQAEEDLRSVLESSPRRHIRRHRELIIYKLSKLERMLQHNAMREAFKRFPAIGGI